MLAGVAWLALAAALLAHASGAPLDLHTVRWADVALPGSVCGSSVPIQLHDKHALISSGRWPATPHITVDSGWAPVVYGSLGGGVRAAALAVDCSNGGGTADSVLAYAQVIFRAAGDSVKAIAVVTPRLPSNPKLNPPSVEVMFRSGEVVATEFSYGPKDPTCCPSGRATTIWSYRAGTLVPGKPKVIKAAGR